MVSIQKPNKIMNKDIDNQDIPTDQQVLTFNDATSNWIASDAGGGGESNTSSNSGAGDGWALAKVIVDLPFKSLITTAPITTTVNANDLTIDLNDLVNADISTTAAIVETKLSVAAGAASTVLTSNGVGSAPTYQAGGAGDMILATAQTSTGKKTFAADATNAGFNLNSQTPTATVAGDIWRLVDALIMRNEADTLDLAVIFDSDNISALATSTQAEYNTSCSDGTFLFSGGALGTPSSGTGTNITGIPTANLINILPDARMPNLTGDVTTVEGAVATTVTNVPAGSYAAGSIVNADVSATALLVESKLSVAVGVSGTVLTSNGVGSAPTYQSGGSGDMVLADIQVVTGLKTFGTIGGTVEKLAVAGATSGSLIIGAPAATSGTCVLGSGTALLNSGPLGQPSSGDLTNCDTLPIIGGTTGTLSVARGGTAVTASTGTVAVVLSTDPVLVTPNLGTPSAGVLSSCTSIPVNQGTGILPDASMPNLTGDITTSEGAVATTISAGAVDDSMMNTTDDAMLAAIVWVIDGGGSTISTGISGDLEIPFGCTIEQVTMLADQSGSIVVDIWGEQYSLYPPTVADTITASALPTISTDTDSQDSTLTGWTTTVTKGDTFRFNVDSVTSIQKLTLTLRVRKT